MIKSRASQSKKQGPTALLFFALATRKRPKAFNESRKNLSNQRRPHRRRPHKVDSQIHVFLNLLQAGNRVLSSSLPP